MKKCGRCNTKYNGYKCSQCGSMKLANEQNNNSKIADNVTAYFIGACAFLLIFSIILTIINK